MSSGSGSEVYEDNRFLLPQGVGDTEEIKNYKRGGFHPVHLVDRFDNERYKVVHKLGADGLSTVWLARDEDEKRWVALKIVASKHSASTSTKSILGHSALGDSAAQFVGPSTSELSYHFECRLTPWLARRFHSKGLCHGDMTTGNLVLAISDLDCYDEDDMYRLFGRPVTGALETESGEGTGPEAPRYVVKSMDFPSPPINIMKPEAKLIDFEQCLLSSSLPRKMLGTPIDFLAPEVAVGLEAGPASDVWALGCCIFRLKSGEGPSSSPFGVIAPEDLVSFVILTLGVDMPRDWYGTTFWDSRGHPAKDASKGKRHEQWWDGEQRSLQHIIESIWDEPKDRTVWTGNLRLAKNWGDKHRPFPSHPSNMLWKPRAIKVDKTYLTGYDDQWESVLKALPKIRRDEATLLYDLLSKILAHEPTRRITASRCLIYLVSYRRIRPRHQTLASLSRALYSFLRKGVSLN